LKPTFRLLWSVSPYINRFLSADSIVPGYANPQSLNRYSYVNNNPLRYSDPTGHRACEEYAGTCLSENQVTQLSSNVQNGNDNDDDDNDGGGNCGFEGVNAYPPAPNLPSFPDTQVLHPVDTHNIMVRIPIYDYSHHPPKIIGYRITSYAIDDVHISLLDYFIPSDPITWTSALKSLGGKLLKPGLKNLASVGIVFSCPECEAGLAILSGLDRANSSITFDAHLRMHDVYLYESPFFNPFDQIP
jgi:hypothetical protein